MSGQSQGAQEASHILVVVVKKILEKVILASEQAVLEVTEKLQGMSTLTEQQKEQLAGALVTFYQTEEGHDVKRVLNDNATAMMEAAQRGDFEAVNALASSPEYEHARKATKKLHDTLQNITTSDVALNDYIMPVLVALQFQDTVRQELEGLIRCLEDYFRQYRAATDVTKAPDKAGREFWLRAAKHFTNIEARDVVLRTALGDETVKDQDIRTAKVS